MYQFVYYRTRYTFDERPVSVSKPLSVSRQTGYIYQELMNITGISDNGWYQITGWQYRRDVSGSCFIYLPYLVYTTCIFNQFSMHASIKRTFYILALLFISVVQEVENSN